MIGAGAGAVFILGVVTLMMVNGKDAPGPSPSSAASASARASNTASPGPTPTSRPLATPTSRPVATATGPPSVGATATPLPAAQVRAPLILPIEIPDVGPRATVQVAGLKVRYYPGARSAVGLVLGAGSELLLMSGPASVDGYDWYEVYFRALPGDLGFNQGVGSGWVAAGAAGQPPTFIQIGPSRCQKVPVTIALLGSMTDIARSQCIGAAPFEVHGMIQTCYEGPETPYTYEPAWFGFSCYYVVELGTAVSLPMHFAPSVSVPPVLALGDLVRLVGHVNDPAAADCRVVPQGGVPTDFAADQQIFGLSCRSAFVVTEIEVTGHIDLPDPFAQ